MNLRTGCATLVLLVLTGSLRNLNGQAGLRTPVILSIPASVRTAGLHEAGGALVGDAASIFTNPAGIATTRRVALEGSFGSGQRDARFFSGALAWRLKQFDLGFGVKYLDPGSNLSLIPSNDAFLDNTYAVEGVGSLVYRFGILAVGGSGKFIREKSDGIEDRALGVDAGAAIAIFDIMAIGFSVQNVGGNLENNSVLDLPRISRLGFSMNYVDPQETVRLLSVLEVQWPEGGNARWVIGGEAGIVAGGVGVVGRVAYGSRPDPSPLSRVTVGASLEIGQVNIDYSYRAVDILGDDVSRIGLRLRL